MQSIRQKRPEAAALGGRTARRKRLHVKRAMPCGGVQSGLLLPVVPRMVGVTRRCFAWESFPVVPQMDFGPAGAPHGTLFPRRRLEWSQKPAGASHGALRTFPPVCCRRAPRATSPRRDFPIASLCMLSFELHEQLKCCRERLQYTAMVLVTVCTQC